MARTRTGCATRCLLTLTLAYGPIWLGCAPTYTNPGPAPRGPRTIVLNGTQYTEAELGKFTIWVCFDYVDRRGILVELGTFSGERFSGYGFVLYDGTDEGASTSYQRRGLNHRWDWGPNGTEFAFVLEPDGTGLFYDFTDEVDFPVFLGPQRKADCPSGRSIFRSLLKYCILG